MKILWAIVAVIVCFYALVRYLEAHSIFYPSRVIEIKPDRFGLPFEDVYITAEDGVKINGWLIKHPSAKSTMLFFHGNAGNISDRLIKLRFFYEMGLQVLIIDYRGYGHSGGTPSEKGIYRDARAAFDYLQGRDDTKNLPVVAYGGSLGGVVAIDLVTQRKVAGLIVDSSFPSAAAMSKLIYPMIPTFFLAVKFDSERKIRDIALPKLFMHSTEDQVVPFHMGERLFNAAAGPKEFVRLTGGHNDAHIDCKDVFIGAIKNFMGKNGWL
jgi:uncharacterized protein